MTQNGHSQEVNRSPLNGDKNVLGTALQICCNDPLTGYFRDGQCRSTSDDYGLHVICAEMTEKFLKFSLSQGNDLSSPLPSVGFRGLKSGDRWCLGIKRWKEAEFAGVAPKVVLEATHQYALSKVHIELLGKYGVK